MSRTADAPASAVLLTKVVPLAMIAAVVLLPLDLPGPAGAASCAGNGHH